MPCRKLPFWCGFKDIDFIFYLLSSLQFGVWVLKKCQPAFELVVPTFVCIAPQGQLFAAAGLRNLNNLTEGSWPSHYLCHLKLIQAVHPATSSFNQCPSCPEKIVSRMEQETHPLPAPFVTPTWTEHDSLGLTNNYVFWTDQFSQFTVQSKLILWTKVICQQGVPEKAAWLCKHCCPHPSVEWPRAIWCHYELINWWINSSQHLGSPVSSCEGDWWADCCFSLGSYFLYLTESRRQKIAPFVNANRTTPSNAQHSNLLQAKP